MLTPSSTSLNDRVMVKNYRQMHFLIPKHLEFKTILFQYSIKIAFILWHLVYDSIFTLEGITFWDLVY